jgi:hypothetical protein
MSRHVKRFFKDIAAAMEYRRTIKQTACPHCGLIGFLICHGFLWGYGEEGSERVRRGCRFLLLQSGAPRRLWPNFFGFAG